MDRTCCHHHSVTRQLTIVDRPLIGHWATRLSHEFAFISHDQKIQSSRFPIVIHDMWKRLRNKFCLPNQRPGFPSMDRFLPGNSFFLISHVCLKFRQTTTRLICTTSLRKMTNALLLNSSSSSFSCSNFRSTVSLKHDIQDPMKVKIPSVSTIKAPNFMPHGNFPYILASFIATLGELIIHKNEWNRICRSELFLELPFPFFCSSVGHVLMLAKLLEKMQSFREVQRYRLLQIHSKKSNSCHYYSHRVWRGKFPIQFGPHPLK